MRSTPGGERFPHWIRLRRRRDYLRTMESGRKHVGRFLVLYAVVREEPEAPTRLGLTVSRRIGDAVVRNAVKRRLRDMYRRRHARLVPGFDVVANSRVGAATADYAALAEDFDRCLTRLGLWATQDPGPTPPSSPVPAPSDAS